MINCTITLGISLRNFRIRRRASQLASAESSYSKELAKLSKTVDQKLWKRTDKEIGYERFPHLSTTLAFYAPPCLRATCQSV